MFENVGEKLKVIARILGILGIIASVVGGIFLFKYSVVIGFLTIICGGIVAWINSMIIVGIGLAAEHSENGGYIANNKHSSGNETFSRFVAEVKNKSSSSPKAKNKDGRCSCPNCFSAVSNSDTSCPYCGTRF